MYFSIRLDLLSWFHDICYKASHTGWCSYSFQEMSDRNTKSLLVYGKKVKQVESHIWNVVECMGRTWSEMTTLEDQPWLEGDEVDSLDKWKGTIIVRMLKNRINKETIIYWCSERQHAGGRSQGGRRRKQNQMEIGCGRMTFSQKKRFIVGIWIDWVGQCLTPKIVQVF